MFAWCHFGSSIDAAGACHRHRSQIAASANYKSGRHIASAVGKHAGQAAVLKRPTAKMCSQPRASSGVGASNGCVEDAQGLASGGNALGAAVAELSALNQRGVSARATSLGHPQIVHSQLSQVPAPMMRFPPGLMTLSRVLKSYPPPKGDSHI